MITVEVDYSSLYPPQHVCVVEPKPAVEFDVFEPRSLEEFIGQDEAKVQIKMEIESARRDNRPLRHIFLYGPPGTGKTTLIKIIASTCGGYLYETTGAQFSGAGDVIDAFDEYASWPVGTVWLIDEVSEMARIGSTVFHAPMTQKALLWKGEKTVNDATRNLILAATTNYVAKSPGAFRDRFDIQVKLGYYTPQELRSVAEQVVTRLDVGLSPEACIHLAKYAAGTPRQLNRLIRTAVALVGKGGVIGESTAKRVTDMLRIYKGGLSKIQLDYIRYLSKVPKKTMGKNAISAALGEDARTLEEVWEPFLLYEGMITITGAGRRLTDAGEEYLTKMSA
jgi:Holliday junction DNA helicase RuvB